MDSEYLDQDKDKFRAHVCEHDNDISGSILREKFADEVKHSQLPKQESDL
jgi:hypothetical protein